MTINDFALACAIDASSAYFTYHENTMLMIQSEKEARAGISSFALIEPFMEALISHESIHVIIKSITDTEVSDALDDLEVIVEQGGKKFQVTLNNILFATDNSGLVLPY